MVDYKENGAEPKPSKIKEHFRKFWWLHLINFVVGTLLFSLLLTYVGLPNIAQGDVNKAEMIVDAQVVSEPTPQTVQISINSTVNNKSLFTPTLDAFNVSLFLEDTEPNIKPFGQITIPSVHATKTSKSYVSQTMQILDQEQFSRYNVLVTTAQSFRVAVRGRTRLDLGALPLVSVDYNKAVNLTGLNNFAGIQVNDIKVSIVPLPDGSNMNGTIVIPNPSVMTITVGDIVQSISAGGKLIGNSTIKNVVLKPGPNSFFMSSVADQATVITLLGQDKSKSGILAVEAKAISVSYKGQRLPYFEAAMSAQPVKLNLNLKDPLTAIGLGGLFTPTTAGSGTGGGTGSGSTESSSAAAAPSSSSTAAAAPVASSAAPAPAPAPAAPAPAPAAPAPAAHDGHNMRR